MMINIVYNRTYLRLTMQGHALCGVPGQDLVCAAASILLHTLAEAADRAKETGSAREVHVIRKNGEAEVSCVPMTRYVNLLRLQFDTVCAGFGILAQKYPQNVSFEIRG